MLFFQCGGNSYWPGFQVGWGRSWRGGPHTISSIHVPCLGWLLNCPTENHSSVSCVRTTCCSTRGILRHPKSLLDASHQALRRDAVREQMRRGIRQNLCLIAVMVVAGASCAAQQPEGPQSDAPPPVAPKPAQAQPAGSNERITVPAGTRVSAMLRNGISTRSSKPRASFHLQTSLPI